MLGLCTWCDQDMMVLHIALDGSWKLLYTFIVSLIFSLMLTYFFLTCFVFVSFLCTYRGRLAIIVHDSFAILFIYLAILCMFLWWMIFMNIMSCFMVACLWLCHVVHPYHFVYLVSWHLFMLVLVSFHVYPVMLAL